MSEFISMVDIWKILSVLVAFFGIFVAVILGLVKMFSVWVIKVMDYGFKEVSAKIDAGTREHDTFRDEIKMLREEGNSDRKELYKAIGALNKAQT